MKLSCPVSGCQNHRPAEHAMCRPCWSRLPRDLQQPIYRAWRERLRGYDGATERHQQAIEDACAHLEGREPVDFATQRIPPLAPPEPGDVARAMAAADVELPKYADNGPDPNSAASYAEDPLGGAW